MFNHHITYCNVITGFVFLQYLQNTFGDQSPAGIGIPDTNAFPAFAKQKRAIMTACEEPEKLPCSTDNHNTFISNSILWLTDTKHSHKELTIRQNSVQEDILTSEQGRLHKHIAVYCAMVENKEAAQLFSHEAYHLLNNQHLDCSSLSRGVTENENI